MALFAILAFASTMFLGCDSLFDPAASTVVKSTEVMNSGKRSVTITAGSENNFLQFTPKGNSRTILPTALSSNGYTYYIAYTNSKGDTLVEKYDGSAFQSAPGDSSKGTLKKEFVVDTYDMRLYALDATGAATITLTGTTASATTDEANVKAKAVLMGYAKVDLRFVDVVNFYLTANNLKGKGTFSIDVQSATGFYVDDTLFDITVGLYNCDTNALVEPATPPATTITVTSNAFNQTFSSATDIPSGAYNLCVNFVGKAGTYVGKTYVYSERVIIVANRPSNGTVIVPDIIAKPPRAPKDFIAGYKAPNSETSNVYTVEFAWTDTSYSEKGYEIELLKADNAVAGTPDFPMLPTDDTTWAAAKTTYATTTAKIFDSAYHYDANGILIGNKEQDGVTAWKTDCKTVEYLMLTTGNLSNFNASLADGGNTNADGGSLNMNSNHLKIYLPLDHRYVARIRAVNDAGASDYTYLTLPQPQAGSSTIATAGTVAADVPTNSDIVTTSYTLAGSPFATDVQTLNLYRIKYVTSGGSFKKAEDGTAVTVNLVQYKSQQTDNGNASTTAVKLLTPDSQTAGLASQTTGTTTTTPLLYEENTPEMTGNSTQTGNLHIELRLGDNAWSQWQMDSESGPDYPRVTANPSTNPDIPDIYTKYESITLFANYSPKKNVQSNIQTDDLTRYEVKDNFFDVGFFKGDASGTDANTAILGSATGTLQDISSNTTFNLDLQIANYLQITLNANAQYDINGDGTPETDINYDSITLTVKTSTNTTISEKTITDFSKPLGVSFAGHTGEIVYFKILAKKGIYTYEVNKTFKLNN